jgi:5'-nucleotidase/UDP-sugar diphosphatase
MNNNENNKKQIKNYKPIIVLGLALLIILGFFIFKNVDAILLKIGIYDQKITILNTADVHGHIAFDDSVGGYYSIDDVSIIMGLPLVKHLKDEIKKKEKDILFFDCGDLFHGTNEANIEKGKGVVEIANLMGYDAMEPGNHDFNFGIDRLMEIKSELKFPMISSNMYQNGKQAFEEYKIYTVKGIKVAVFGLETPAAYLFSNTRDFKGITINDPVETAQKLVPQLRKQAW